MYGICKITFIALALAGAAAPYTAYAQTMVEMQHDRQKEKQLYSIEVGPWDFEPEWYYYINHRNYSGASLSFSWDDGFYVKFREADSNVKTVNPERTTSLASQELKLEKVKNEYKRLEEMYKDDLLKQADRSVDLSYGQFEDDFNSMQDEIQEHLVYCMKRSKGKMKYQIDDLTRKNEIICSNIEYIHKTGPKYQLENAKRQQCYEDAYDAMSALLKKSRQLKRLALILY